MTVEEEDLTREKPVDKPVVESKAERASQRVEAEKVNQSNNQEIKVLKTDKAKKSIMDNLLNSSELLRLLDKWKIHLLVIVVIAAVLGMIFSGPAFITPLFKSYAVAYPANIDSYSEESNTEQMLQILNSQDITDRMIEEFDLGTHYEINREYKYYRTALMDQYHEKVSISKTPYESIMIEILDKDPEMAKKMVDKILELYDWKVSSLHKSKYVEVVKMYKEGLARKRHDMDSLKSILAYLGSEKGVFEVTYQSQEITKGYLGTVHRGNSDVDRKESARLFKNMGEYSGQLIEVTEMLENEAISYIETKKDLELAERFVYSDMTYSNIITYPSIADKKTYPIRWLVVAIVSIAALVFAFFVIIFIENRKSIKA